MPNLNPTPTLPADKAVRGELTAIEFNQLRSVVAALAAAVGAIDDGSTETLAERLDTLDTTIANLDTGLVSDPMQLTGVLVIVAYYPNHANGANWYYPNTDTVPVFTNRTAPVAWMATEAQMPAVGVTDTSFKPGDVAMELGTSL